MSDVKSGSEGNDGSRRRNMVNIWLGKQMGPELEAMARREEEITGRRTTRIDLARELLTWAIEQYRQAGSLRTLKETAKNGTEVSEQVVPQHYIESINKQVKQLVENQAEVERTLRDRLLEGPKRRRTTRSKDGNAKGSA